MKRMCFLLVVFVLSTPAFVYGNPLETRSQARERHRSQEYETRQNNPYGGEPIGGYSEKLGDPRGQVHERSKSDPLDSYGSQGRSNQGYGD